MARISEGAREARRLALLVLLLAAFLLFKLVLGAVSALALDARRDRRARGAAIWALSRLL